MSDVFPRKDVMSFWDVVDNAADLGVEFPRTSYFGGMNFKANRAKYKLRQRFQPKFAHR